MGSALSGDDERLRLLLEAWAELPESVKTAVLEMVGGSVVYFDAVAVCREWFIGFSLLGPYATSSNNQVETISKKYTAGPQPLDSERLFGKPSWPSSWPLKGGNHQIRITASWLD